MAPSTTENRREQIHLFSAGGIGGNLVKKISTPGRGVLIVSLLNSAVLNLADVSAQVLSELECSRVWLAVQNIAALVSATA